MELIDAIANYLITKQSSILADTNESEIRKALLGFNETLEGMSSKTITSMFNETKSFKRHVDKRVDDGLETREDNLRRDFKSEKDALSNELEQLKLSNTTLKANMPLSADPAELRKQALDEPDITKREMLNMKADNIELKNQNAERTAREEQHIAELNRKELESVARKRLGDRKLPSFVIDNIGAYLGSDEETTIGKIDAINSQWDDYTKDMITANIDQQTPPGGGEEQKEYNFNKVLEGQNWMNK